MLGEVLAIGDELTSGQRLDTNSQWLSERLGELGVRVMYHTTVADDLAANIAVFRAAIERADVVVASGGLGPTADDLTRDALAAAVGVELELFPDQLRHIEGMFAQRRRPMPERNRLQAMFPRGSQAIFNPEGTAPGIDLTVERPGRSPCRFFALPGVPAEMKPMFRDSVAPAIRALMPGGRVICHRRIKCYGAGESHIEALLPDLIRRGREPSVGITVHKATITLRITAAGASHAACLAAMQPTVDEIRRSLGNLVFGEEDDELQEVVVRLLRDQGKSLATVECGTAGLIAHWLGDVPGAADVYRGGLIVTSEPAAQLLVGHSGRAADAASDSQTSNDDFSPTTGGLGALGVRYGRDDVRAWAEAARRRFRADYAVAIGPFPATSPHAPAPEEFHIALASSSGVAVQSALYAGHSDILKDRAAKDALNYLRLERLTQE